MNGLHEKRVIVFLDAITTGLMSVRQIKRFVAGAKVAPFPNPKTLGVISAAEDALVRHRASRQARRRRSATK